VVHRQACSASAPLIRKIYVAKSIFILGDGGFPVSINLLISLIPLAASCWWCRIRWNRTAFPPGAHRSWARCFVTSGLSLLLDHICIEFHDVVQIYAAVQLAWM